LTDELQMPASVLFKINIAVSTHVDDFFLTIHSKMNNVVLQHNACYRESF